MRPHVIRRIVLGTTLILLIPLIAMQFSDQMNWSLGDFVIMGALLIGSGLIYELIASKVTSKKHRVLIGIIVIGVVLFIWAELAVGVLDIPGFSGS